MPMIDMTAMVAMQSIINNLAAKGVALVFCGISTEMKSKLQRAGILSGENIYLKNSLADSVAVANTLMQTRKNGVNS